MAMTRPDGDIDDRTFEQMFEPSRVELHRLLNEIDMKLRDVRTILDRVVPETGGETKDTRNGGQ